MLTGNCRVWYQTKATKIEDPDNGAWVSKHDATSIRTSGGRGERKKPLNEKHLLIIRPQAVAFWWSWVTGGDVRPVGQERESRQVKLEYDSVEKSANWLARSKVTAMTGEAMLYKAGRGAREAVV